MTFGNRLKDLRKKHGLSMDELGKYIGTSSSRISDWENAKTHPSSNFVVALSDFFNVSTDWLLKGSEPNKDLNSKSNFSCKKVAIELPFKELRQEEKDKVQEYIEFLLWKRKKGGRGNQCFIYEFTNSNKECNHVAEQPQNYNAEEMAHLPLLGNTAAGKPLFINELLEGYIPVPKKLALNNSFLVRAKGDSMIGDGINDGDIVIVRQQPCVDNGDIALVRVDDESTIKHFYIIDGFIMLKASNPAYQPLIYNPQDNIAVIGKVISVLKKDVAEAKLCPLDDE